MTDFSTIYSNNLEQITMISGDEQKFIYDIYTAEGFPLSVVDTSCSICIFNYGDPDYIIGIIQATPVISGSYDNRYIAYFSGSGLSGIYQQQVRIKDYEGNLHIPAQGKIIIFSGVDID